jgi:hypothetical protein
VYPIVLQQAHPTSNLNEVLVLNLSSMYELSSTAYSMEAKGKLGAWVSRIAPDDFDLSCVRMGA